MGKTKEMLRNTIVNCALVLWIYEIMHRYGKVKVDEYYGDNFLFGGLTEA